MKRYFITIVCAITMGASAIAPMNIAVQAEETTEKVGTQSDDSSPMIEQSKPKKQTKNFSPKGKKTGKDFWLSSEARTDNGRIAQALVKTFGIIIAAFTVLAIFLARFLGIFSGSSRG